MLNSDEQVGACAITVGECLSGAHRAERSGWLEIFERLEYWHLTPADAVQAGIWRYEFRRSGVQLTIPDTLIAALAQRTASIVVTDNLRDFPMDDVVVQSLS
jgi:predicted nucleic acid-binding protein